jgi:hypothetical protein
MKNDINGLAAQNDYLVLALDMMTDRFNAQNYELRIAKLRVQNLEVALALKMTDPASGEPTVSPGLPVMAHGNR